MASGEPGFSGIVCRSPASSLPLVEKEQVDVGMKMNRRNRPENAYYSNHGKKSYHQKMSAEEHKVV